MSVRRTTPAQALAGIITAEAVAGREATALELRRRQVPQVLEELAAKPCARPSCRHRLDQHGAPAGPLAAFHRHSCAGAFTSGGVCSCREFLHA